MIWDFNFEKQPTPSSRGFVMGEVLRDTKSLFRTMISNEHTFDTADDPEMSHKVGECTVVGEQTMPQTFAVGGIAFGSDSVLRRITSFSADTLSSVNHAVLTNKDNVGAHTQYVHKTEESTFPSGLTLTVENIVGLDTSQDPASVDDNELLSQGSHLGGSEAKHANNCIPINVQIDGGFIYDTESVHINAVVTTFAPGKHTTLFNAYPGLRYRICASQSDVAGTVASLTIRRIVGGSDHIYYRVFD